MLNGITKEKEVNQEETFKTNLINFAKEHKDIVRYAQDMDKLVEEKMKYNETRPWRHGNKAA